jgi:hypothetical protein
METLKFSAASDVWSFAIQDGVAPYKELKNAEVMQKVMAPNTLVDCNAAVYEMLCQCWETDPAHRPRFRVLQITGVTLQMA